MRLIPTTFSLIEPRALSPDTRYDCTGHGVDGVHTVVYPGWYSVVYPGYGRVVHRQGGIYPVYLPTMPPYVHTPGIPPYHASLGTPVTPWVHLPVYIPCHTLGTPPCV